MLIDWFTVGAQIFNFLILVYLLKRFLYRPILGAMDRREEAIASRMRDAEAKRAEAAKEVEELQRHSRELDQQRSARLREIEEEARQRRAELLEGAREEAGSMRDAWKEGLRRERSRFLEELKGRAAAEVVRLSRRALSEIADDDLMDRIAGNFAGRLSRIEGQDREKIAASAVEDPVTVQSPVELGSTVREDLAAAIRNAAGPEAEVGFAVDASMPPDVRLTAGDLRLSWGVESYFAAMEQRIAELVDAASGEKAPGDE